MAGKFAKRIDEQMRCALVVALHTAAAQREYPTQAFQKIVNGKICQYSIVDLAAQEAFIRTMAKKFPTIGWYCEENNFVMACEMEGHDVRIVLDPIDGSMSEIRNDGFGVGTMAALVIDGEIVASYVGDVDRASIVGFGPGSPDVFLWRDAHFDDQGVNLTKRRFAAVPLCNHKVLLRREADEYEWPFSRVLRSTAFGGAFSRALIMSGSLGLNFTHLWRGGVAAVALPRREQVDPWDAIPLIGINRRMGMTYVSVRGRTLFEFEPRITFNAVAQPKDVIVIHSSSLPDLQQAIANL